MPGKTIQMKVCFEPGIPLTQLIAELEEDEAAMLTYEQCMEVDALIGATRPSRRLVKAAEEVIEWAKEASGGSAKE